MQEKTKSISAIALILGGLALMIGMFVIFLNQKNEITALNGQLEAKKLEYANLYEECLENSKKLDNIDKAAVDAQYRKAENGKFHLGISSPSLTNAENLEFITHLKQEGYNIWYMNENTGDLGNIYHYKNGVEMAKNLQSYIFEKFPNRSKKLDIQQGGNGGGIPASIRDYTILIKL